MANTPAFDLDAFGNTPMNCMTLIAGKAASATGHVLVGHNEDDDGQRAGRIQIDGAQGYGVAACAPVRAAAPGSGGRDGQKQGGTPSARRRGDEKTIREDRSIEA